MSTISVTVNGRTYKGDVEPRTLLVHYLRDQLNLTGTHVGCDTSQCGACTILLDGVSVNNKRITRQPLKDGDNVVIGKTAFRFAIRPARSAPQANS